MKADDYGWWKDRLRHAAGLFDKVRIDHFRAFSAYWAVPFDAETAKEGKWEPGVGEEFFQEIFRQIPGTGSSQRIWGSGTDRWRRFWSRPACPE